MTELSPVDSRRASGADSDPSSARLPPPVTPATPPSPAERSAAAAVTYDRVIGQAPAPAGSRGSLAVFLAHNVPVSEAARTAKVQEGLDAFRDRASGPYAAEGSVVHAAPQFAMGGGFNHPLAKDLLAVAAAAKPASLARFVGDIQVGRGTPEHVAQMTQALIDAGKLPAGTPENLVGRIHQMQWRYGVGFDCAGYTQQAVASAAGQPRSAVFPNELTGAISFARLQKVPFTSVRAGDLLVLDPPANEQVGHKTAVYAHTMVTAEQASAELVAGGARSFQLSDFGAGGPIHRYELDASWGAGPNGDIHGGYRRETALYNESSGMWAWREPTSGQVRVTALPYDHPIDGAYRPRTTM